MNSSHEQFVSLEPFTCDVCGKSCAPRYHYEVIQVDMYGDPLMVVKACGAVCYRLIPPMIHEGGLLESRVRPDRG